MTASPTPAIVASTKAKAVMRTVNHSACISVSKCSKKARTMSDGAASTSGEIPAACTCHSQKAMAAAKTTAGMTYLSAAFKLPAPGYRPERLCRSTARDVQCAPSGGGKFDHAETRRRIAIDVQHATAPALGDGPVRRERDRRFD